MRKFYAATLKAITTLAVTFGVLLFNTASAQLVYCTGTSTRGSYETITSVISGSFTNTSVNTMYANYTSLGAINAVPQGSTFTINIKNSFTDTNDQLYIFGDWNQDGDFGDVGETTGPISAPTSTTTVTVSIPADALIGNTTLRIKLGNKSIGAARINNDPCQTFTFGEVEDYLINVYTAATITTESIDPLSYCAGSTVAVPFITSGYAGATTFTVQLSDAAGSFSSPTNLQSGSTSPINATIPAATATGTGYRIRVVSSSPAVNGTDNGSNITINALPAAPSGSATQAFCSSSNPDIGDLMPNNASIKWYSAATGGTLLTSTTALADGTSYYASQTNGSGCESSARLAVTAIISTPLTSVSYGANPVVYCAGLAIAPNNPTLAGGMATSYSVTPGLPAGLSLNTATGVISGIPTATGGEAAADYTVTASNDCGSVSVAVNITISPAIPSALTYTNNTPTYCSGTIISNNSPFNAGGAATSYSVSPGLPAGLLLDPATGVISGTPTATGSATYRVTAGNLCGTTFKDLVITITSPPTAISYGTNPVVYCAGAAIVTNSPTVTGGAATSYTASSLPAGLAIDATTGVISGTPTATAGVAAADYTITASNDCGSVTVPVNITISPAAPSALTYTVLIANYCAGAPITNNNPSNSGGAASSYSVSPSLPTGLSLDPVTGVISGTPTATGSGNYTVTATNSCGSATKGLQITISSAPADVSYGSSPVVYCAGAAIAPNSPTVTGGAATSFTVGSLPAGLTINPTTGVITGTPTATGGVPATDYAVTASNNCGSVSVPVNITILPAAPTALNYSLTPAVYCLGAAITPNNPSNSGGAPSSYSISPALPPGLTLNTTSGVISGTPTAVIGSTNYTVTAANSCGSTIKVINIGVTTTPSITYSSNPVTYCAGVPISNNNTPANTGGNVTIYSVSPGLPTGLNFNTTTGVISGTPTTTNGVAATDYVVTATSDCGSVSVPVNITISPAAPTALNYSFTPAVYCVGTAIMPNNPSNSGGAPSSYSINPALPAGLSLNTTTGVISGTPGAVSASQNYTVTATNSCGSTTKIINIAVTTTPSITYSTNPVVYCAGVIIDNNTPTNTGGVVTSYSINPALPSGLNFNTTTGIISGNPATMNGVAAKDYVITANSSCGSVTIPVNITISPAKPANLNYTAGTAAYCVGAAIAPNTPSNSGGAPSSYSVNPALPAGLNLNAATGVISGTPTTVSPSANYTVTAGNSCGSTTKVINIGVTTTPSITYSSNPVTYCAGALITNNTPANMGGAVTGYSISPALPAGLNFSTTTGIISGNPSTTNGVAAKDYIVTANSSCGSVTIPVNITISPAKPASLNYTATTVSYCINVAISPNNPSYTGGAPTSYVITPSLPAGLTINPNTGVISGTPTASATINTFTVTASNSCGSATKQINITVNDNATIALSSAPGTDGQTTCVSTSISNIIYQIGGGGTGATVTGLPGGLASNYNSSTKKFTISGSPSQTGTFTYTVKTVGPCAMPSMSGTITVNQNATVSLTSASSTANQTVCASSPVADIKYTIGGSGTGATVTGLPSGITSNFAGGILTISGMPAESGSFNYTVIADGPCAKPSLSGTITSIAAPTGTFSASATTVCAGQSVIFTFSNATYGSYIFKLNGVGTALQTGTSNVYSTTTLNDGDFITVDVANSNNCGARFTSGPVTIKPLPVASLTPDKPSPVCEGDNVTFTALPTGVNFNYLFKVDGVAAHSGTSNTFSTALLNDGQAVTVEVTDATGCVDVSDPITYTITPLPNGTLTATTTTSVCLNGVVSFQATGGASYQFMIDGTVVQAWSATSTFTRNFTEDGVVSVSVANGANGTGCIKTYNPGIPVTVNPLPTGTISVTENSGALNNNEICQGSPVTYTFSQTGNTTYEFFIGTTSKQKSGSNKFTTTELAQGDVVTVVVTTGSGCSQTFIAPAVTVVASPAAVLSVDPKNTICVGDDATFTSLPLDAAFTYNFKVNGASQQNSIGNNVFSTSTLPAGTYPVIVGVTNSSGCATISNAITMTVSALPTGTMIVSETSGTTDNDGIICTGGAVTFTAPAGFNNYNFLLNGVSVQNGSSGTYTVDTLTKNTTVTVAVTNATGCIAVLNNIVITVNPLPTVAAIQGPDNVCKDGTITLTDATNSPAGAWSSGNTAVATVDAITGVVTGVTPGTVTINYTYTNGNGCSSTVNKQITVNPPPVVAAITGNFNICKGLTSQLSDATSGGVWSSGSTDVATIDASTGVVTGVAVGNAVISYTYTDANGCSATVTAIVTVTNLPTVAAISTTSPSGFNVCVGGALHLKDATTGGTWSSSAEGTATVSASGVVTGIASGPVDISYTITTSCGQNATTTQTITVNAPPSATISYGGSPYCTNGGDIPVTQTGTTDGIYSISPATGGVSINPETGTITPGATGGNYTVTYTVAASGGCATYTTTANVTITTAPAATIAYAGPYCTTSSAQNVTRTGTPNGIYSYTGAGTLAINETTGAITPANSTAGTYTVTYTVNTPGCAPFSTTATVTITQAPSGTFAYSGSPYCTTSGTVNITDNALTSGGTFTAAAGLTIDAASGKITPATSTGGTYTVTYKILGAGGCGDFTTTASVTIAAAPTAVAGTAVQTCANSGAVNVTAGAGAANYSSVVWTSTGTGSFTNANSLTGATYQPSAADIATGSVTLKLTANPNSPCAAAIASTKVLTISAITPVTSVTADPSTICLGSSSNLFVPGGTTNLISENFESGGSGSFTVASTGSNQPASSWINRTSTYNYQYGCFLWFCNEANFNSGSKFMLANSNAGGGSTNTALVSSSTPTTGYTSLTLSYRTYFEASRNDYGYVEVSTDGGTTWTTIRTLSNTTGSQGNFSPQTFSLNAYINLPSVMVRFRYSGNDGAWWAIDDVKLTGTSTPENYSWTATPATTAGLPANSGTPSQSNANIVVTPTAAGTYIYKAILTNAAGCTSTKDVAVTVNQIPAVGIITDYCSIPNKVLLTATAPSGATFSWNTGKTTDTIQVDVAGAYTVTATLGGCSATATSTVATELVNNGTFTNGNDGSFSSDYTYKPDLPGLVPAGQGELYDDRGTNGYSITTNGQNVHKNFWGQDHTNNATGSRNFMAVNGHSDIITVWKQTVNVLPGTKYYFSAWAMSLNNAGPFAQLRFNVGGADIGTTAVLQGHGESNSATDNWVRFYGDWTSGPTTTSVVISIVDLQSALGGNDFGLDDISFGTLSTFITLISPQGTDAQTVCKNSAIADVVYNVGNGSVNPPTVTGLPAGITTNFAGNTLTFSGTPTVAGNYSYTITTATTAGCAPSSATGTITVLEDSIKLTSGSAAPVCKDVAMPSLVYTVGGTATAASITAGALPTGVTGLYDPVTKTFTISGTPTDPAGTYNYTVTTSGGNCTGTAASRSGTITIQAQSITLTSAAGTNNQTKCINTAITNIQYTVSGTGTGATVTGLPNGVTGQYQSGIFTIKGTPTQAGTFNYEINTSGNCKAVIAKGTIIVTPAAAIALTSASGTETQTLCTGVAITPIVYTVSNATGASIIAGAYPAGITGVYDAVTGTYTISGTPTETVGKVFNYTVGTSGGCASDSKTGSITVTAQTVVLSNGNASQTVCQSAVISPIVYTISGFALGATVEGLPNGMSGALSNGNTTLTLTGSTTDPAGTYNYTVRTTGSQCGEATATGTITISAVAVSGTVAGTTTCSGGSGTLTLLGNSTNPIRWESSLTNGAPWTTIANTTVTLNYSNVTVGTYYRAVVGNGCGNAYSDVAYVGVHNLWTGATNTDWNTGSNWSDGKVPSGSCPDVYIPGGTPNQPTLSSGTAAVINLHIHGNGFLTVSNATLQIGGIIDNTGTFDATAGTLEFNGTTTQTIDAAEFNGRTIENLVVSNNDLQITNTVDDTLNITGLVSFGTGTAKLNTGNNLTLKSTKDNTASIGELATGNVVTGQVEVERYINIGTGPDNHAKTWQFLATPTQGASLKNSWMEGIAGVTNTNSTGYGAQFTGTSGTTGYDGTSVAPSVKLWDPAIGNWKEFSNANNVLFDTAGYFAFVRGDRGVSLASQPAKPTTLRSKGTILTGDQSRTAPVQTPDNVFFSIGNPYPSAVDMTQVQATINGSSALLPFFYVWNPGRSDGYYYVGAWNTYVLQGGHYKPVPDDHTGSDILESGQAFLMQVDQSHTTIVTFKENYKVNSGLTRPFREQTAMSNTAQLVTNLLTVKADGSTFLADGTLQQFDNSYTGKIDRYDARKITNSANNFAVKSNGINLVVERRQPLTEQDTIQFNLAGMAKQNFRLEFKAQGLSSQNVEGFVEDTYLDTRTPLNMEGTTNVDFAVTSDKGSYAANRFRIVFKTAVVLPVKFVSVTAVQKDEDIQVDWKVENEKAVKQYDVEKSVDGVGYKKAFTVAATNNGAGSYQWLDEQATPGDNYYRIRMEDQSGKISYSAVVKVSIPLGKPSIGIYPNPITDGIIHLQLVNQPKGRYGLRLLNPLGQTIIAKQVEHAGGNATENIKWDYNLAHGVYQLQVLKPDGKTQVIKVMY